MRGNPFPRSAATWPSQTAQAALLSLIQIFHPLNPDEVKRVRQQYEISDERQTFLIPSGGHKTKGLPELLSAFSILDPRRYELLIAGQKTNRHLPPNSRFIGYIDDLAPLYAAVDCTILPSHYEAFGLVVPESLACGTPVIVTRVAGSAELLSENEGIVISDNSPVRSQIRTLG